MKRPLGHIPDYPVFFDAEGNATQIHGPGDYLLEDAGRVMASRKVATTDSIDFLDHLDEVQDQLGGTCVGQSSGSSIFMRAQIQGKPIKRPSAALIVAIAQMMDAPGKPIDCDGCRPALAITGLRERGIVALEEWPETEENLVTIPPEDVFARAEGAKVDAYYRIPTGGDVVAGFRAALARGFLPIFAMQVDTRYENIGADVYDGAGGAVLGNHAQCVVGYSAILRAFRVLNSWGRTFGDGGVAWVSEQVMAQKTFDRLVIESTPQEV